MIFFLSSEIDAGRDGKQDIYFYWPYELFPDPQLGKCKWNPGLIIHVLPTGTSDTSAIQAPGQPRKYFKHFQDDKIEAKLTVICRLMGFYGECH